MTSAVSHDMMFGKAPKLVYVPQPGMPFDLPAWLEWLSGIVSPTIEKKYWLSTAINDPAAELAMWQPHNGLASHIEIRWDAIQTEMAEIQLETITEEDILDALLTL